MQDLKIFYSRALKMQIFSDIKRHPVHINTVQ